MKLSRETKRQLKELYLDLSFGSGPYFQTLAAKRYFIRSLNGSLEKAGAHGGKLEIFICRGRVSAAVLLWPEKFKFSNSIILSGLLLARPGDNAAKAWLISVVKKHKRDFRRRVHISVFESNRLLLQGLENAGLYVEDVLLSGGVERGLKGLAKKYGNLAGAWPNDLVVEPLSNEKQLRAGLAIYKREFSRNPQFGWFAASPHFLRNLAKSIRKTWKSQNPSEFVILKDKKVVGQIGYAGTRYLPHLKGRRTGLGLTLDQSVQNQGLSKYCYYFLLRKLQKRGIKYIFGGTAQKPTMRLARTMGRWPVVYIMSDKKHFGFEHFRI